MMAQRPVAHPPALDLARYERRRRLAVLFGAVSLALFIIALALLTTTVYSNTDVCGSALSRTQAGGECDVVIGARRGWGLILGCASPGFAAVAFRFRWGRRWTKVSVADDR